MKHRRRRTWRPLHGRLWNLLRHPRRSPPGDWARPKPAGRKEG